MKTLKDILTEGILDDIEDTISAGDDSVRNIEDVFKQLKSHISKSSNWSKTGYGGLKKYYISAGSFMNFDGINGEQLRCLLQSVGIDSNHFYMSLEPQCRPNNTFAPNPGGPIGYDYWKLIVKVTDSTHIKAIKGINDSNQFIKTVYIPQSKTNKYLTSVIKNYIKPAMNSLDSFRKFIDNIQKLDNGILDN